ncbi:S-methyl-5'-thioadenosine phosphorylase protein [Halorhabdus tiamatea SARL4B]|uniref:Purine nucleoside phosphorylase n=1 Tax=Halorhabdus tiamatea SARL4B TaxID=1033806 RepID=F7PR45_9EURY|nr:S-methyl-5'-thioadenosine phosphorylase [Halorhabdus tiamatea]ERJ07635.1 S-methyl-5'-thioadenosine phosphorylase protein [Halorhabdus tiamatea SARL4B]CCQ33413.1 5'-methylthioadenosine phosphorylase [Halorhabdus tiamatea SARL4B]
MPIGFIGGSGIYDALPLEETRTIDVETPYGDPSAPITIGTLAGTDREIAFVPRHGENHEYSPTEVPYRANIYALKDLGVSHVIATNAVGSLDADIPPQTIVVPDQLFDRTRHRGFTFFGDGIVVHQGFAEPFCPDLASHLADAVDEATETTARRGGTYVCIEGPQYSTRAESEFFRDQGWDVVGMTAIPEAKLAREAELSYATIAGVTDWDVWKDDAEVSLEGVLENAAANEAVIKEAVQHAVETLPDEHTCECHTALEGTINTDADAIPEETFRRVEPLVSAYVDR